jgi:REP element-mobilizing transposase RayT
MQDAKYKKEPLNFGNYYHIYNRGNNGIDIFFENGNYEYFLKLYHQYIHPTAETFAWCLMKNHFHFLVYIRNEKEVLIDSLEYSTVEKPKILDPSRQFGHLFNAYTQAINKKHFRTGSLFEKPFERKRVTSETYLRNLIYYIHHNPVHHGFTKTIQEYPWSSYGSIISDRPTRIQRDEVIEFYGSKENFVAYHQGERDLEAIFDLIIDRK